MHLNQISWSEAGFGQDTLCPKNGQTPFFVLALVLVIEMGESRTRTIYGHESLRRL